MAVKGFEYPYLCTKCGKYSIWYKAVNAEDPISCPYIVKVKPDDRWRWTARRHAAREKCGGKLIRV